MALSDFDAPPPGYQFTGAYTPAGGMATQYIGQGVLPDGYNTGAFNPNGSLSWASNAASGGPAVRAPLPGAPLTGREVSTPDAQGRYPWTPGYNTGPAQPQLNLNSLFGNNGPQVNQNGVNQLFASQKSAPMQAGINQAFGARDANQKLAQQSLTDFTKEFIQSRGAVNQFGQQEQDSISNVYGTGPGSMQSDLARLNVQKQAAVNQAAQSAMAQAGRANNFRRMQGGNSSYLDRLFGQNLSNIAVQAAGQGADQGRADLQYLNANRQGLIGKRQQIIDSIMNRGFAPMQAANAIESNNLGALGGLSALEYGNHTYQAPEDAYGKRLGFLQDLVRQGYGNGY